MDIILLGKENTMEKYEKPEVSIILVTDIVTTSGCVNDDPLPGCQGTFNTNTN